MEKSSDYKELQEIKQMMERSSRFLSLSGLSGVSAGIIALIGASIAYYIIRTNQIKYDEHFYLIGPFPQLQVIEHLVLLGLCILVLALGSGLFFSWRKARKNGLKLWDHSSRRMLFHLFIPLLTGGIFSLILIENNDVTLLASATLIFYGLALLNAGKYTLKDVQYLGILEIVLGLLAGILTNYGLIFWAIGFGVLHIVYGSVMYLRYDR